MHPKVGVFHPGTQHSWQTALAFQEQDQLSWYATSIFYDPSKWPYRIERILPDKAADKLHRQFLRRHHPHLDLALVRQLGTGGWLAAATASIGSDRLTEWATRNNNLEFAGHVIKLIEREPVDVVWGYDTASLDVFRWAKKRGIYCVLDRTIGHSAVGNRIMEEEYARHPEFFSSPFIPKPQQLLDEEQEEIELADIVLVGAPFGADTLRQHGCPPEKLHVVRYGFDEALFPDTQPTRTIERDEPIKFLFAGGVSPRKGIAYLLQAFAQIPPEIASLTLVGGLLMSGETFSRYSERVTHIGSVSRRDVVKYFSEADCFIFPSLFESGPIVLRETYGVGLGAIHSSVCEGVSHGINGLIFDAPSINTIVTLVTEIAADRKRLTRWQQASWEMRADCTWSTYRRKAADLLNSLVV